VATRDGKLFVSVRDDGIGGADLSGGSGLVGLRDRVEALGGELSLRSPRGEGTLLDIELPLV
jgi:signal transduction histidine kinase